MNPIASRPSIAFNDSRSRNPVHPVRVNGPAFAGILGSVLAAAVLAAAPAAAQDERFAGTWQKDYSRSDAPWPGRHDRPQVNAADIEIEIRLEGEDIALIQTSRRRGWPSPRVVDVTYITNNKPHAARDLGSGSMLEVRARWRKKKLNVSYTVKLPEFEADVQQIWEITKDGDLLQTIFGRGAAGRPDIRKNYYVPATVVQ
ncbi:MAG: hypothetical protein J4F98_11385 [Acidobacteria bacterium]|nr:hypothetical protein [Acidobacteriota bacterium]